MQSRPTTTPRAGGAFSIDDEGYFSEDGDFSLCDETRALGDMDWHEPIVLVTLGRTAGYHGTYNMVEGGRAYGATPA